MRGAGGSDLDTTRLMPAVTVVQPADQACTDWPVAAAEDDETYTPGDSLRRAVDSTAPTSSVQPRALPAIAGLSVELGIATQRHDGLPKIVHAMATAAGNGAAAEEVDLLRVHVDTALHHVLAQYPRVDPALLLNCMLLAATERSVTGDPIAANYHFAWFRELDSRR